MILRINEKDYELNFGLKFCREISKNRTQTTNGIDIRLGIENAVSSLYTGDVLILPELIKAGTITLNNRPSDKEIEEFLDNSDNLDELCEDFLLQLTEQSATKKKAVQVLEELEKVDKKKK